MKKYIGFMFASLLALLCGCADETFENGKGYGRKGDALPVRFLTEVSAMEDDETEKGSRVDKTKFEEGEAIHVFAVFTLNDGSVERMYECLQYKGGEWVSTASGGGEGSAMSWPWNAGSAVFEAYYAPGLNGFLSQESPSSEVLLDRFTTEPDPLHAKTEEIDYGAAVHLDFTHLCAKLTFKGLDESQEELWLKNTGLADAFRLVWNTDGQSDEVTGLDFEFLPSQEREESNHRVAGLKSEDGGGMTFYVAPGDYGDITLAYPYNRPYLALKIEGLNGLQANHAYTVEIKEGSGSVVNVENEEEWWNENEDDKNPVSLDEAEINALLQHIHDGTAYTTPDGTPILDKDAGGGTVLLRNLDFQNRSFTSQTLPNSARFNGNYHFINNVSQPIFTEINGEISNLGVKSFSYEGNPESGKYVVGALGESSSPSAAISNVRLKEIAIEVIPPVNPELLCDVGALVGSHAGTISGIRLGGNIHITACSEDGGSAPGRVNLGGLVGQSSGRISGVSMTDDERQADIRIECDCRIFSDGAVIGDRYVGGLVGLSTGQIEDCTLVATVNSIESQGVLMYTGGLVGMVRSSVSSANPAADPDVYIRSCTVSGTVTGGLAFPVSQDIYGQGHAYTGGLVGYAYYAGGITDCRVLGTVRGHASEASFTPRENAYYALGGAFGQVYKSEVDGVATWCGLEDILSLKDEEQYRVGVFAGRADASEEELRGGNESHGSDAFPFVGEDEITVFEGN